VGKFKNGFQIARKAAKNHHRFWTVNSNCVASRAAQNCSDPRAEIQEWPQIRFAVAAPLAISRGYAVSGKF
jgi:hypothetical protein